MRNSSRTAFLEKSMKTLTSWLDAVESSPMFEPAGLDAETACLVIVDMIEGFARTGALSSPRVDALTAPVADLLKRCTAAGMPALAFADSHTPASPEFASYPPHCLAGTVESELLPELRDAEGLEVIPKNSVNGFLEPAFQDWLDAHPQTDAFIVCGDCTDICVLQFATTLKAWFNRQDRKSRVIVPADAVDTYDYGPHDGDLTHLAALYNLSINGIEIVRLREPLP